ncbi:MAG: CocE/NonD family hydrolase [Actinomycetota bacterium]
MRRLATSLSIALIASALVLPLAPPAQGAKAPLKCTKETLEGKKFRFCTGMVPTKDGAAALDTDVTLPAKGDGPFPMIVILHHINATKATYEQRWDGDQEQDDTDTIAGTGGEFHYNNAWFASRGYAVMNYTTRGYNESKCLDDSIQAPDADPALYDDSPACAPHVAHKDMEVKDAQHLIGRMVDRTLLAGTDVKVKRRRVGVTGVSYGAGSVWQLARMNKWKSPKGRKIKLAAVAPITGWTDLMTALAPNGVPHAGHMPPADLDERLAERPGVPKESFITAFRAALNAKSGGHLPGYLTGWIARLLDGEPYDNDEVATHLFRSALENRSAYYTPRKAKVPIFSINGWTDQIFGAIQPVQMANRLKQEDPDYPIRVLLNDFGHAAASNPQSDTVYQMGVLNDWFDFYLRRRGAEPEAVIESSKTVCADSDVTDATRTADVWDGLSASDATFDDELVALNGTVDTSVVDPHASLIDPVPLGQSQNKCLVTDTTVATGNVAASVDLPDGLTMLGFPMVTLTADPEVANMYLAFRLWDVDEVGATQTLVDRGVFRLGSAESQTVVAELNGNHYEFLPGHSLKLEITANEERTYLQSNAAGEVAISDVSLTVPMGNAAP